MSFQAGMDRLYLDAISKHGDRNTNVQDSHSQTVLTGVRVTEES